MDTLVAIALVVGFFVFTGIGVAIQSAEEQRRERRQEAARRAAIYERVDKYGEEVCLKLIEKRISPGMTKNMVVLSWGKPGGIDQREVTKTGIERERWVYGRPRRGASYVYFKNGTVDKIKQ